MSWSFQAFGEKEAVLEKLDLGVKGANHPAEQTQVEMVIGLIKHTLENIPTKKFFKVEASGSQYSTDPTDFYNNVSVKIEAISVDR